MSEETKTDQSEKSIEVKDRFTVKTKVTEHPNASKYPGRPSFEVSQSKIKFLNELSDEEIDLLVDGKLIVEPEMSAQFFDSLLPNDVVGLALFTGLNELNMNIQQESTAYKFKVLDIDKSADTLRCRNISWESKNKKKNLSAQEEYRGQEVEIAFEDVSVALGMGFAEILERDGKPFGVPEEVEQEVVIVGMKNDATQALPENTTPDVEGSNGTKENK
jgi:hypothetical protein